MIIKTFQRRNRSKKEIIVCYTCNIQKALKLLEQLNCEKIESLKRLFQSNTSPPSRCFHPRPDKGGFGTVILFYSYFCPPHPFTFFIMEMKRTRPSLFLTARVWPEYYSYTILTIKGTKTSRKLVFPTNELSMLYKVVLWTFIFCITATRSIQWFCRNYQCGCEYFTHSHM